jgi:hypothetical protein
VWVHAGRGGDMQLAGDAADTPAGRHCTDNQTWGRVATGTEEEQQAMEAEQRRRTAGRSAHLRQVGRSGGAARALAGGGSDFHP